ncbi:MAG: undecaprenyl/decaprenyl-phosphate alpha-N-acetylglucosaminyl 1-phosphate transferase [Flavobacteriaceae bacterium]|jgi:UDP-GlcNAc:undecaprenyl-phosphate/decaprenyl-phosphate GlcNAc-1-phosphate transferase|nr:undecaprenyl/decaprenyl-phosphate alpha-N-acetylglucosaminyl 1-phosphate transferase [Flavobacteriaceae bacterium]
MLTLKFVILYILISSSIIYLSIYLGYFDKPNKRGIHRIPTINTGGLIIYLFFLSTISQSELNYNIELIISIGFFVCLTGFVDDRINLNPSAKIVLIIIPSIYLILNGISISDLGQYEYLGKLELGKFKIPFLLLAIGLLINATNYIDGIDGLLLIFFISCLVYYIFLIDDIETINLLKFFVIACFLNLILNLLPSKNKFKVFSGDSGSLFIGFFISFMTIELYNSFNIHPAILIWPLWYPVYDFLFVSINRLINKKSIFKPDNTHLHHIIYNKFNGNRISPIILFLLVNSSIIILGYKISEISKLLSLSIFIIGFTLFFIIRLLVIKGFKS